MSLTIWEAIDTIAVKARTIEGVRQVYTATGSGITTRDHPIPQSIDDTPVMLVWMGAGDFQAGNAGTLVWNPYLLTWFRSTNAGAAFKAMAGIPQLAMEVFHLGQTLGGVVTRCLVTGWDNPYPQEANGQQYLILPLRLEVLLLDFRNDGTA